MATIIDKLLNRDTENKPSAEELRQIADLARQETTRLAELIDQARRELEAKEGIQESIKAVESRISSADGTLKAFEQRATAARETTEAAAELEGRIGTLDQLVTSADARIRQVEARNGKLSEARASIEKLISSSVEAEAKVASFKNQAKEAASVQGDVQRVKSGLDQLEEQFGLIHDDYERLQDTISALRKESGNIDDKARFVKTELARAEDITHRVEDVVKSLSNSQALSKATQDQLRHLNALAQHVGQKLRSLGATKELVDRATGQLNEVNELVWNMDRKLKKTAEESQWLKEIESNVERFQELQQQFANDLQASREQKSQFTEEGAKLKKDIAGALGEIQQRLESAARHLSIMLCPRASFRLESCLKHGVELVERGRDGSGDAVPLSGLEGCDDNAQFEFRGLFGMEVSAAVTTQNLELFVDGLDGVGR